MVGTGFVRHVARAVVLGVADAVDNRTPSAGSPRTGQAIMSVLRGFLEPLVPFALTLVAPSY